ncbi:MAG: ankyrin repeat domain-containing protein [Pseudomonadota bacterium]
MLLALLQAGCAQKPPVYGPETATIRAALAQGADPNQEFNGWRPLNYNVAFSHPSSQKGISAEGWLLNVELLLKAGADPNAPALGVSRLGMTPLAWAVRQCRAEMVRLLLANGADPYQPYYREHADLGTYLTVMVSPGTDPFCQTVDEERSLAFVLLDHIERTRGRAAMLDFVRTDPPGAYMPTLHNAALRGYYGVLAALIEKRVDLDQMAQVSSLNREWTALHLAEALGRADIADALRRGGARDDIRSNRGETPASVRGSLMQDSASVELGRMATQIVRQDVVGFLKEANRDEVWRMSMASGRQGVKMPPPGWTGLEDAIRKAQAAREAESRPAGTR